MTDITDAVSNSETVPLGTARAGPEISQAQQDDPSINDQGRNRNDEVKDERLGAINVRPAPQGTPEQYSKAETRAISHKFVVQRPRALQYTYHGQLISAGGDEEKAFAASHSLSLSRHGSSDSGMLPISKHEYLGIEKLRERLDLFTDLIWVGIINNLSEVFSSIYFSPGAHNGEATLIFTIAFVASWRIWNILREFMGNYYMDDILQRVFIFWIFVLSVFYGNNLAYLAEDFERTKGIVITFYLMIRGSFVLMEAGYSIFIPWLRLLVLVQFLLTLPSAGLWVAGIFVQGVDAAGPIICALVWEYLIPALMETPIGDKFTPTEYRKAIDPHHFTSRYASFFIIIVGEGVLQLIARGPLGSGLTETAGTSIFSLSLYFILSYLYFNRDSSKTVVPAVRRHGWRLLVWVFFHIPLFASFLTMTASIMFLLRDISQFAYNQTAEEVEISAEEIPRFEYLAVWCISVSLAIIVLSMTVIALLDKPLDPPGTLRINNRYARLASRFVYVVVILTVPVKEHINPTLFLGIAGIGMSLVTAWEWHASLERGGSFFEPKSLAAMVAQDKKKSSGKSERTPLFEGLVGLRSRSEYRN